MFYRDEDAWCAIDGRDGTVLERRLLPSNTLAEIPIVADLDEDCDSDLMVGASEFGVPGVDANAIVVYDLPLTRPARAIWNQVGYHVTSVGIDGSIATESPATTHPGLPRVRARARSGHPP